MRPPRDLSACTQIKDQTNNLPQYDNCFPPEIWIDDCFACNGDPNFDSIGKVNGSCTDATPPTGYYSWNNTSGFCAYDFPVDGIDYTTKYTALKFRIMQSALEAQNRTILYSLCEWGMCADTICDENAPLVVRDADG
jgi:alpha-galactosidase